MPPLPVGIKTLKKCSISRPGGTAIIDHVGELATPLVTAKWNADLSDLRPLLPHGVSRSFGITSRLASSLFATRCSAVANRFPYYRWMENRPWRINHVHNTVKGTGY